MNPHRFIVPIKNVNTFCTFLNGQLRPENPLPTVGYDEYAIDTEFGWVAWVADEVKTIGRTHLDAVEGESKFAPLAMPKGYQATCLLFHQQVLFVGGRCGTEILGSFDFSSPEPAWVPLEVPEPLKHAGKRIDDLLLDGDQLIAVDNIVFPKYLLLYDVADARSPRLTGVHELGAHGVYEHIRSGALGLNWVALLSTSYSSGGGYSFISLLGRRDFDEHGWLETPASERFTHHDSDDSEPPRTWHELAFTGDVLLIAADTDGVGVLDLKTVPRPAHGMTGDEFRYAGRLDAPHQQFIANCRRALSYIRPTNTDGIVLRVLPIPDTRYLLAVVKTEAVLDTVVMELP